MQKKIFTQFNRYITDFYPKYYSPDICPLLSQPCNSAPPPIYLPANTKYKLAKYERALAYAEIWLRG